MEEQSDGMATELRTMGSSKRQERAGDIDLRGGSQNLRVGQRTGGEALSTIIHVCVSIRGFLKNERFPTGYTKLLKRDDGTYASPSEAREYFMDALAKGWKVLPTCDCEGFDYEKGCPGRRVGDEKS